VTSARICIVVSSDTPVLDAPAPPYLGCSGETVTPTDKRLYRAFTTTVVLQNRIL
jgi:type IV pilus assembly protein PilW